MLLRYAQTSAWANGPDPHTAFDSVRCRGRGVGRATGGVQVAPSTSSFSGNHRPGECDLAIDDMVRGAVRGACPVPVHIIGRLHEWLDSYDATACTDPAQLRGYVNRLRCA